MTACPNNSLSEAKCCSVCTHAEGFEKLAQQKTQMENKKAELERQISELDTKFAGQKQMLEMELDELKEHHSTEKAVSVPDLQLSAWVSTRPDCSSSSVRYP